jgi:hypothetical protein
MAALQMESRARSTLKKMNRGFANRARRGKRVSNIRPSLRALSLEYHTLLRSDRGPSARRPWR